MLALVEFIGTGRSESLAALSNEKSSDIQSRLLLVKARLQDLSLHKVPEHRGQTKPKTANYQTSSLFAGLSFRRVSVAACKEADLLQSKYKKTVVIIKVPFNTLIRPGPNTFVFPFSS